MLGHSMHLETSTIIVLSFGELVGLIAIVRLWCRKRRMRVITRLLWSLLLLIPFFGILLFAFTRSDPEPHSDEVPFGEGL
jgi:hypothetical protein